MCRSNAENFVLFVTSLGNLSVRFSNYYYYYYYYYYYHHHRKRIVS